MRLWQKILICVVPILLSGFVSGLITASSVDEWYRFLEKPPGTPPDWLFAPVWSLLYTMMGLSLALVWHRAPSGPLKTVAVAWFVMQFALNLAWTPVFFGARQVPAGLVVIVGLLLALVMTIVSFFRVERLAAWLLVPYLLWVGYATYLNAGIFVAYK